MGEQRLTVFDRTTEKTYLWLDQIGETLGPDRQRAYHALRAVLFALRDRLTINEAFHLSAQLPILVRGIYWDGYRPSGKPEEIDTLEEFVARVARHLDQIGPMQPEQCVKAVFEVLDRYITEGELQEVRQMLPEGIRDQFPQHEQWRGESRP